MILFGLVYKGVWYYIGAHAWNIKELFPVWPTLGDKVGILKPAEE